MTNTLQTHDCAGRRAVSRSLLAGCVTINIYFPASAAEKAADTIIDEVWQMKGKPAATAPESPTVPSSPKEKAP